MSASSAPTSDASKTPSRAIPKVQKALVTGANSGIGKATAIALGQAGADVVVNYVSGEDHADAVVGEISRSGAKAYAHKADVSQEEQVQEMFRRMPEELGTIERDQRSL
jgi:glucose 1-dehydrogenase